MKILVKVKAGAREDKIMPESKLESLWSLKEEDIECFKVSVKAVPEKGKANDAVAKLISEHFGIPQSKIRLLRGATSRQKIFEIKD